MKILVLPPGPWEGRPQRTQGISAALAKFGHEVTYVTSFESMPPRNRMRYFPISWPTEGLNREIPHLGSLSGIDFAVYDLVLVFHPSWSTVLPSGLSPHYDLHDRWWLFPESDELRLMRDHLKLIGISTSISVSSHALVADCEGARSTVIYNASEATADVRTSFGPSRKLTRDAVYVGAIAAWFDVEWVYALSRSLRYLRGGVHLVGAVEHPSAFALLSQSNIRFYGELEYSAAMTLASRCFFGIVPFRTGPLAEAVDPIKIYDYLGIGLQVLANHRHGVDPVMLEDIHILGQKEIGARKLLQLRRTTKKNSRLPVVSWEERALQLLDVLNDHR